MILIWAVVIPGVCLVFCSAARYQDGCFPRSLVRSRCGLSQTEAECNKDPDCCYDVTNTPHCYLKARGILAMEGRIVEWIEMTTEARCHGDEIKVIHECLKDGVVLCKLINKIADNPVKVINHEKIPSKMVENIEIFLEAAENYGVSKSDLFQTSDLMESRNVGKVVDSLVALKELSGDRGFIPSLIV